MPRYLLSRIPLQKGDSVLHFVHFFPLENSVDGNGSEWRMVSMLMLIKSSETQI